ncbi:Uncharacterised protein [Burkholderia cepacia]|uniref:Uncharacterized protein n=1 Tax=Burkholderia cepacia TaxID=292 RepID=A0AAE8T4R5_BURCE|nr:hypothetical protein [Burkholderia cepacia]POM19902.1 hypothetical protein CSX04_01298 [Burkholderia cepacia]SPV21415.1 Uncharacterised protein [Burkholderia cepacia]
MGTAYLGHPAAHYVVRDAMVASRLATDDSIDDFGEFKCRHAADRETRDLYRSQAIRQGAMTPGGTMPNRDLKRFIVGIHDTVDTHASIGTPVSDHAIHTRSPSVSDEIAAWFSALDDVDLSIPWTADDLLLYGNQASLARGQAGYRVDASGRRLSGWHDDWIVLGQMGGDPVIVVPGGDVLFDRHGAGFWAPSRVASSLTHFAHALCIWCELYVGRYSRDIFDDTYEIRPAFLAEVRARIGEALPDAEAAVFMEMVGG